MEFVSPRRASPAFAFAELFSAVALPPPGRCFRFVSRFFFFLRLLAAPRLCRLVPVTSFSSFPFFSPLGAAGVQRVWRAGVRAGRGGGALGPVC